MVAEEDERGIREEGKQTQAGTGEVVLSKQVVKGRKPWTAKYTLPVSEEICIKHAAIAKRRWLREPESARLRAMETLQTVQHDKAWLKHRCRELEMLTTEQLVAWRRFKYGGK